MAIIMFPLNPPAPRHIPGRAGGGWDDSEEDDEEEEEVSDVTSSDNTQDVASRSGKTNLFSHSLVVIHCFTALN